MTARRNEDRLPANLRRIPDNDFGYDQARHLLLRAGFGGTPQQIRTLASWGPERAVDYLLGGGAAPGNEENDADFRRDVIQEFSDAELQAYRRAQRQGDEDALARFRLRRQQMQRDDRRQMAEIQRWWLEKMIETPAPLTEKMTLFWHGHFATSYRTIENSFHMLMQNELFRANALGNFGDLLFRIIRDPAMLAYLDNTNSRVGQPNENLARELMELFSLGVGGYTESDIKEGARALTGYTFSENSFVFNQQNHDTGNKNILGSRGPLDGDDFVRAILAQRRCSQYMSGKFYSFFALHENEWADDSRVITSVIDDLASEMLRARYDVKPVLRKLFLSEHFYHSRIVGQRIKSPAELIVGAVRTLNTPVRDLGVLLDAMDLMGQSIYYPPSVAGWDGGRSWINTSTIFVRHNALNFLLTGKLPVGYDALATQDRYDPTPLLQPLAELDPAAARDPGAAIDYILRFTIGSSPRHARDTLASFAATHGNAVTPDLVTGMLLLVSAMPEYQLT